MKRSARLLLFIAALALLPGVSPAEDTTLARVSSLKADLGAAAAGVSGGGGDDPQLASRRSSFEGFARTKLREMNDNHIRSRTRMRVEKKSDGLYRAFYHQLDDSTISCKVSRSPAGSAQYVAVLSYQEKVFETSCTAPEACREGRFTPVEVIPNRHIFVYSNGRWQ